MVGLAVDPPPVPKGTPTPVFNAVIVVVVVVAAVVVAVVVAVAAAVVVVVAAIFAVVVAVVVVVVDVAGGGGRFGVWSELLSLRGLCRAGHIRRVCICMEKTDTI